VRLLVLLAALAWSATAAADLYRWVDPETGAVKFSSYPPPWYGDDTQRRAPKVEHIPPRGPGQAGPLPSLDAPPSAAPEAGSVAALERERRALLAQIAEGVGRPSAGRDMQKQLEAFSDLSARLDKLDPAGAAARRTEAELLLQRMIKGGRP
jgi:hypothetical protein